MPSHWKNPAMIEQKNIIIISDFMINNVNSRELSK